LPKRNGDRKLQKDLAVIESNSSLVEVYIILRIKVMAAQQDSSQNVLKKKTNTNK